MGIVRAFWRLLKLGITAFVLVALAMLAWTFLWPEPEMNDIARADVIICMGGGMDRHGTLAAPTLKRVERCVQLYEADRAPLVLFTGGTAGTDSPSAASQMGRFAQSLGLPADRIIEEGRAQSTLQNALFSLEMIGDHDRFIVVSEAFHLPRSWASFQWARWELGLQGEKSFALIMSENVRRDAITGVVGRKILIRETFAIWFNAARAMIYSLAGDEPVDWLR